MASTRTDDATRIAQFPAETYPRAVPISIRIGEQSTLHLQLYSVNLPHYRHLSTTLHVAARAWALAA